MLRSLKGVYKAPTVGPRLGLGPPPDPGPGSEDPPPAFLHVQPAGPLGDEGMADAGMILQPGAGALAVVAGQVIGDHPDRSLGVSLLGQLEEVLVEGAVAGRGAHGDRLPAGDPQPAVDPGLLRPAGPPGRGCPGSTAPGRPHHQRTAPRPHHGPAGPAAPTGPAR